MKQFKFFFGQRSFTLKSLFVGLILFSAFSTTSCSKDDDDEVVPVVYSEENPLDKYQESAGFTTTSNFINAGNYEFGLTFSPNVKGKINSIHVKLPDANPSLKVTIWDFASKTVLRTETVNVTVANVLVTKSISELLLEKDKKYVITMNSNDWYKRAKADNSDAVYPITSGNIKFWDYRWIGSATQVFPTNVSLNYNGGDLSFNFQQMD